MSDQAERLQAERDQLAEVLRFPGVRKLLLRTHHPDTKAARLGTAERAALAAFTVKLIAAYDLIEKVDKAAKAEAAQAEDEAESEE
jgi:hypothetical protein